MEAWDLSTVHVRPADLSDPADGQAVVELIDLYARDPMGGGRPLDEAVKRRLAETLRAQPQAHILLAMAGSQPVGIAVCMLGFSSFRGRPLLNLHDLAVHPDARGQGVGRRLLAAVEAEARRRGCCRLTLEVRADNVIARRLYQQAGFDAGDPASDAMSFLTKEL